MFRESQVEEQSNHKTTKEKHRGRG